MRPKKNVSQNRTVLGWREWVGLSELGIEKLKCKVDTGARSSALHTYWMERFYQNGAPWIRFKVHPLQGNRKISRECTAEIEDERYVSDSGGHRERRIVIVTPVSIGNVQVPVEMTLTDRDTMRFRMLLGRTALNGTFVVDPARSYVSGRPADPISKTPGA